LTLFLKVLEKQQEASISTGLFAQKMGKKAVGGHDAKGDAEGRIVPGTDDDGSERELPEKSV
jgi:hypothetical protein